MSQLDTIVSVLKRHGERIRSLEVRDLAGESYDYTSQSTIVGWVGSPTGAIYYKRISSLIEIWFYLSGTSNSANTNFTLPFNNNLLIDVRFPVHVSDNGGAFVWGIGSLGAGSSQVNIYATANFGAWTSSGSKIAVANFSMERS